ncbi:SLC13 family permease [Anaerotruncus rubiinfantis]|uniref:SLC13 family permease n=1 Tax=Anaerotruncus rubiinfantis TaxID=1720200 RepID=UPI000835FCE6|nr:hypothetical protein [Anaerotruncus rubiinfantis]
MAQRAITKRSGISYYAICIVCIALMFLGGLIPPFAPEITKAGMQILCIYVALVFLWSSVGGVIWPSILAIVALGLTEFTTVGAAVVSALGQNVSWQIMMCIALTHGLTMTGAGEFLAKWIISRKFLQGRPYLFTWVLLTAFSLISALSAAIGMILLAWAILNSMATLLGVENSKSYFRKMSVFMVVGCCCGELIILYKSWVVALWSAFGNLVGQELDYLPYMVIATVIALALDLIMTLLIKVMRVDVSFLRDFDNSQLRAEQANERLTGPQIAYLVAILGCVIFSLGSSIFPQGSLLFNISARVTPAGVFAIAVVALILIKDKNGKPILDFQKVIAPSPFWPSFMICASSIPLANALCSEGTGFMSWITRFLSPIFENSSLWVIYAVIVVASLVLTNIASCSGVAMMMLPVAVPLAVSAGANMYIVGICTIYSCLFGFILPGSSGLSAMMYGTREQQSLSVKDIIGDTSLLCAIYGIAAIIIFPILDKAWVIL